LRNDNGPSVSLSPPAPSRSATTSSMVRLLGSRLLGVGGLTAEATSRSVSPSAAAKRCRPRTAISALAAETADSGATLVSGSPRRNTTRKSLTSASVTLAKSSMPRSVRCSEYRRRSRRYELNVLAATPRSMVKWSR
jgi:hypothetical protein